MTREEFEVLVREALDSLPEEFATKLDNVNVIVEPWPTQEQLVTSGVGKGMTLFGLYQGVPQTKRGNYTAVLPDKIYIFAGPILTSFPDPEKAKNQIRSTVLHEIGHHFGMSEEAIRAAESHRSKS